MSDQRVATPTASREDLARVARLARLPDEIRQSPWAISITRLTVLKSLCRERSTANQFVVYLARKILDRIRSGAGRKTRTDDPKDQTHLALMAETMGLLEEWLDNPTEDLRKRGWDLIHRMKSEQNEHQSIPFGAVRQINDWELVLFEEALQCVVGRAEEAGHWAYQLARDYAEQYEPSAGTGLIGKSLPFLQEIIDFWTERFLANPIPGAAPSGPEGRKPTAPTRRGGRSRMATFTPQQGQFLAFIHLYQKLHRQAPGELDMARFFQVTPSSVHDMVVKLEELGLITKERGVAGSIRLTVPEDKIPPLEDVQGPPW